MVILVILLMIQEQYDRSERKSLKKIKASIKYFESLHSRWYASFTWICLVAMRLDPKIETKTVFVGETAYKAIFVLFHG